MLFTDLLWALTSMFSLVSVLFNKRDHLRTTHVVIYKLLATGVKAVRLVCQCLAADHFILELDDQQISSFFEVKYKQQQRSQQDKGSLPPQRTRSCLPCLSHDLLTYQTGQRLRNQTMCATMTTRSKRSLMATEFACCSDDFGTSSNHFRNLECNKSSGKLNFSPQQLFVSSIWWKSPNPRLLRRNKRLSLNDQVCAGGRS